MKVIKNALLYTMESINNENGFVAFKNGKIEAVGRDFDPEKFKGYEVIDAEGKILTPGLVEPHSHLGIMEEGIQFEGSDGNELTNPIYPELRGIDALNPNDKAFKETIKNGITTIISGPGSGNIIGGTFTAIKPYGTTIDEMVIKEEVCMKMALGENPKRVYSNQKKSPSTRMASAALIREWLSKARDYHQEKIAYKEGNAEKPKFDMKLESLSRVFDGMFVKIHAHRSDDIMTAIRIAKEFDIEVTIEHATEAHLIAKSVKKSNVKVILGPTMGAASKYETKNRSFDSGKILDNLGIEFAIMTDHPVIPIQNNLIQAALFVKHGLSPKRALEALTINAAKLNKLDDRLGSIKVGKDADLVLWDGDIFDIMTRPSQVFIDGQSFKIS